MLKQFRLENEGLKPTNGQKNRFLKEETPFTQTKPDAPRPAQSVEWGVEEV
jgi:hypothetical protein